MLWQVESLKTLNSTVPRHKACWAILRLLSIRRSCYFSAILPLFWQDRNWRCIAVRVLDVRSYCASWFLRWQRSQGGGLMSKFEDLLTSCTCLLLPSDSLSRLLRLTLTAASAGGGASDAMWNLEQEDDNGRDISSKWTTDLLTVSQNTQLYSHT